MKKILASCVAFLTSISMACTIVLPYSPSGPASDYVQLMRDINPDIGSPVYAAGAFSANGINVLTAHQDYILAASPNMFSSKNPNKNPPINVLSIPILYSQVGLTNKNISFTDILTKQVNIGIPIIGGSQHLVALELKKKNPLIEIIPSGSGPKGLQLLANKEVDMFIIGGHPGNGWAKDFGFQKVFEIPLGKKEIVKQGITIKNYAMFAFFSHTTASPQQIAEMEVCLRKVFSSPRWADGLAKMESASITMSKNEERAFITEYAKELKKNDF